jgi:hypothetical protein
MSSRYAPPLISKLGESELARKIERDMARLDRLWVRQCAGERRGRVAVVSVRMD